MKIIRNEVTVTNYEVIHVMLENFSTSYLKRANLTSSMKNKFCKSCSRSEMRRSSFEKEVDPANANSYIPKHPCKFFCFDATLPFRTRSINGSRFVVLGWRLLQI